MSIDELVEATAQKPQPAPRTRKVEPEKPVEEMSIDEMAKVVEETREEPGNNVKSTGEISETSEDEQVLRVSMSCREIDSGLTKPLTIF